MMMHRSSRSVVVVVVVVDVPFFEAMTDGLDDVIELNVGGLVLPMGEHKMRFKGHSSWI